MANQPYHPSASHSEGRDGTPPSGPVGVPFTDPYQPRPREGSPQQMAVYRRDLGDPPHSATTAGHLRPRRPRRRLVLVGAAATVLALGVLATTRMGSSDSEAPTKVVTRTAMPAAAAPTTPSQKAVQRRTQPRDLATAHPGGTVACPPTEDLAGSPIKHSASDDKFTTCAFAEKVRRAYVTAGGTGSQALTVSASSPVTGKDYQMTCQGGPYVRCTGGNNAVVYLYG